MGLSLNRFAMSVAILSNIIESGSTCPKRVVCVAAFMSLALLAPAVAVAVPLNVYESAQSDRAKQTQILNDAYSTAVARTVTGLRSSTFTDGKLKSPQRLENDRKLADVVDRIATHPTVAQSQSLLVMIEQYAAAQPNTELEDVISSFLLTEAKK